MPVTALDDFSTAFGNFEALSSSATEDASPSPTKASSLKASSLFESEEWLRVLDETYDLSFHQATLPDDAVSPADEPAPSLVFATSNSAIRPRVISLPFSDYVDTASIPVDAYRGLVGLIQEVYPSRPLIVKTTYPHDTENVGAIDRTALYHRVPTSSHEAVDDGMRSSFQRGVRKARREDVNTERSRSEEALSAFYQLHKSLRFGKFGKIPQPKRFFQAIRRRFLEADRGFLLQATRHGRVIASALVLQHEDVLYYKFGASAKDALDHRPNNILFHDLMHHSVDAGCTCVDLGLSGTGDAYEGLRRFKESFGGVPRPVTRFRIDPPGYDAAAEEELNELLGSLTDVVVDHDLDDDVTDAISSLAYPYFA
jgi:hypothetical protein